MKYITHLEVLPQLSASSLETLKPVSERFAFRTNEYYNGLINWNDPDDPIRKIVIPDVSELDADYGWLDASDEARYVRVQGLQHKYSKTALILVNNVCAAYCRFCFRKRLFQEGNEEASADISDAVAYIRLHNEIDSVVLSGGDPLILSSRRLAQIISELFEIDHVRTLRIGTKIPAFNPHRILDDADFINIFRRLGTMRDRRIYLMNHYTHFRELTPVSIEALRRIQECGINIVNQTPLLRGINDDAKMLAALFTRLSQLGVMPYYMFIGRPTAGNAGFSMPVERAIDIFQEAVRQCSGLAKTVKLIMSHSSGKLEVLGYTGESLYLRYHQCPDASQCGRILICRRSADGAWFDELSSQ